MGAEKVLEWVPRA